MTAYLTAKFDSGSTVAITAYTPDVGSGFTYQGTGGGTVSVPASAGYAIESGGSNSFVKNGTSVPVSTAYRTKVQAQLDSGSGAVLLQAAYGPDWESVILQLDTGGYRMFIWDANQSTAQTLVALNSAIVAVVGTPFTLEIVRDPTANTVIGRVNGTQVYSGTPTVNLETQGGANNRRTGFTLRGGRVFWQSTATPGDPDPEGGSTTPVTSDLTASYSVLGSLTPVTSDLAASYSILSPSVTLTVNVTNNTGTVLTSTTFAHVTAQRLSDRAQHFSAAALASDSSGNLLLTGGSLVAATDYIVTAWNADGSNAGVVKGTTP